MSPVSQLGMSSAANKQTSKQNLVEDEGSFSATAQKCPYGQRHFTSLCSVNF